MRETSAAATRKEVASMMTTPASPNQPTTRPASAGPARRAKLLFVAFSELAVTRRSSSTRAGKSEFSAGSLKIPKQDWTKATAYTTHSQPAWGTSKRGRTERARSALQRTTVFLRSQRSTNTPATDPKRTLGKSPAANMAPVASADPVAW